jgi:hypothetical protein
MCRAYLCCHLVGQHDGQALAIGQCGELLGYQVQQPCPLRHVCMTSSEMECWGAGKRRKKRNVNK